ncbi:MAG: hypothetical protein JXN60_04730 [Lentisphaerae bacterium]|nr:hypothetical protein [Lentisphaerota bacterium]
MKVICKNERNSAPMGKDNSSWPRVFLCPACSAGSENMAGIIIISFRAITCSGLIGGNMDEF